MIPYWKLAKYWPKTVMFTLFSVPMFICEFVVMALVVFINFTVVYLTSEWFEQLDDVYTERFQMQQERMTELIRHLNENNSAEASKPPKSKSKFSIRAVQKARRDKLKKKVHFLLNTTPSEYVLLERKRQQEGAKLLSFLYSLSSIVDRNRDWDLGAGTSEMSVRNSVVSVYKNIEMRSSCQIPAKNSSLSFRSIFREDGNGIVEISSSESFTNVTITRENKSSTSYV